MRTLATMAVGAFLALTGAAAAQTPVTIGYLGLSDDPRYQPQFVYTRLELEAAGRPADGAVMGVADMQTLAEAAGFTATLDQQSAPDLAGLVAKVGEMSAAGERFIILDLPADLVDQVAAQTTNLPVTLLNATASQDWLRTRCYPNLLHTAASDRMEADALTQLLRLRNYNNVLMLVGPLDRDKELAATFRQSAERLRLNIVDERAFTLATDAANMEQNNPLLLTGGADYDVIYIADSEGTYGRYLPYSTQLPRPVVGTHGLEPSEWQWAWDRDGATQVTIRFDELTEGRHMRGEDWSTWIAAKAILQAYGKSRDKTPEGIDAYLRGDRLKVDGSKGVTLNFRPWDKQLRMPIVLATENAVIAEAPLEGFEHQINNLDTLGTDEPEFQCQ